MDVAYTFSKVILLGTKQGGTTRNPVKTIKNHQRFSMPMMSVENDQADAGRDSRTCIARPKILRRERGQGKYHTTYYFPV